MKRIMSQKVYLVSMIIMSLFVSILSGCGGGGGGSWTEPVAPGTPTARPTVTATVPATTTPGPTLNVPINTTITVAFSKDMAPAKIIAAGAFTVTGPGATPVPGAAVAVTYDVASKTATFHPLAALTGGVTYTATVKGTGTAPATDLTGNALAGKSATPLVANDYVWTFTTSLVADTTRPLVTVTVPATTTPGPTLNVASNTAITATFNEDMLPSSVTAAGAFTVTGPGSTPVTAGVPAVTYDVLTRTATFHPLLALNGGVTYTALIKGLGAAPVTDSAGNALAGISATPAVPNDYQWQFTTAVVIPPAVPLAINLRSAESFGIASRAGLTSTGVVVVNGDIALYPLAGCTDSTGNLGASQSCLVKIYASPTGMTVNGSIYWAGDPFDNGGTANSVTNDLNIAWVEGMNKVDTNAGVLTGQLGGPGPVGKIITPGVYNEANLNFSAGSVATFDGLNDPNAIFIIKVGTIGGAGDLTDSGTLLLPTEIRLVNGAQARNIWFVVGRDITIGSGTTWNGNILAGRTAVINNGSTVTGRVLGGAFGAGAVSFTGAAFPPSITTVSVPL